ncbi:MAG: hypothetical protein M3Q58_02315 [Bacteroidota bacterium]|nr:hypothetical protein [Bacteroidota bacterium]
MHIRIALLIIASFSVYIYQHFKARIILSLAILTLIIPFIILLDNINTGVSTFERLQLSNETQELNIDTRTFLYKEIASDLTKTSSWIIGKGSNGTYFSDYFNNRHEIGETDNRLTVEVGILALLLKGGLIGVFLNISFFITAIYFALFQSSNSYVKGLGFMLIIYVIILFLENLIAFNAYNFTLWFFIGVCLNKKIRSLTDSEIKKIVFYG